MSQQYPHDPQRPFQPEHNVVGNSPLNPNYPNHQAPKPPKKPMSKEAKIGWWIFGSLGAVALIASPFIPDSAIDTADATNPAPVVTSVDNGPTPDPITTPTNKPSVPATTAPKPTVAPKPTQPQPAKPSPKPTKTAPALTASQEQAIGTAQDYLDYQSFSRKGLIGQLKFEGFSTKDATFGVDYLKVNWSLQAVGVAKNYLEDQHFSRAGLIDQLEYEGFTHAQAVYGVTKAGL